MMIALQLFPPHRVDRHREHVRCPSALRAVEHEPVRYPLERIRVLRVPRQFLELQRVNPRTAQLRGTPE